MQPRVQNSFETSLYGVVVEDVLDVLTSVFNRSRDVTNLRIKQPLKVVDGQPEVSGEERIAKESHQLGFTVFQCHIGVVVPPRQLDQTLMLQSSTASVAVTKKTELALIVK